MSNMTEQDKEWGLACDILIIGFGAAGACAALEAVANGSEVIIADRFCGGGATILSGNVFYAGGGTAIQKKTASAIMSKI